MMKKAMCWALAAIVCVLFAAPVQAEKMVLRVSITLDPSSHYYKGLEMLDKLLKERTNGDLSLEIYHSAQLGSERDAVEGVSLGTLEMTLSSTGPLGNFTKDFMIFDLPFIIQDREKAYAWMDGPEGKRILDSLLGQNIVGLSIWENGFRHLTNSQRPVVNPEDAKGLKIRLMENPVHLATFRALGAYPTPMPFGELFTAMQQKTVDGQENPLVIIETSKFYEVQNQLALSGHFYSPAILLINKTVWEEKLTEAQRAIFMEAAAEARDWERNYSREMDTKLAETLKSRGMNVTEPDKKVWKEAVASVYKEFEGTIGKDAIQSLIDAQK
ncbi:tripartite ATP-independent transporter DctP family solute receptor [Desulfomicrobium macestii]|uniref:Tripartite ATP-independent transporter DctP family solute receptor n=1 Tax=Desulfomicrobium macestii TaxID=90731 RepID=A0ABR9H0K4_9BACT|nr:TRAP transporter substrate-binding protein [Desulfomicrobium macestii]MBE1424237.1 tripartite ATP-independent transporter DctP family solute receptor [Desulfomicrobium macestii]